MQLTNHKKFALLSKNGKYKKKQKQTNKCPYHSFFK